MRADREIDRGWYFMGTKRRENYDDWWRCEINFEPALDELFGITHAKQGISPRRELLAALEDDLEPIARAVNNKVPQRFEVRPVFVDDPIAKRHLYSTFDSTRPCTTNATSTPTAMNQKKRAHGLSGVGLGFQ